MMRCRNRIEDHFRAMEKANTIDQSPETRAEVLNAILDARGYRKGKYTSLARAANVSQSTINKWRRNGPPHDVTEEAERVADVLHVDAQALCAGEWKDVEQPSCELLTLAESIKGTRFETFARELLKHLATLSSR